MVDRRSIFFSNPCQNSNDFDRLIFSSQFCGKHEIYIKRGCLLQYSHPEISNSFLLHSPLKPCLITTKNSTAISPLLVVQPTKSIADVLVQEIEKSISRVLVNPYISRTLVIISPMVTQSFMLKQRWIKMALVFTHHHYGRQILQLISSVSQILVMNSQNVGGSL